MGTTAMAAEYQKSQNLEDSHRKLAETPCKAVWTKATLTRCHPYTL